MLYRCCIARTLLQFRQNVGWNRPSLCVVIGWHVHTVRAHAHTNAPFVAVTNTKTLESGCCDTMAVTTSKKTYGVIQAQWQRQQTVSHPKQKAKTTLNCTSLLENVLLVPTAGGSYNGTHAHTPSRTPTQKHRSRLSLREKLETWILYHGCLTFDGCCGTSETAAERDEKNGKTYILGVFPWAWLDPARRKAIPRFLARSRHFGRPERAPRNLAGTHTVAVVTRGPPSRPAAESARNDQSLAEQGLQMCKNK